MLHIDPLGDYLRTGHDDFEQLAVRIFAIVVGVEKYSPGQLNPASECTPADDESRVARQSPLGSHLAPVDTTAANFAFRCRRTPQHFAFWKARVTLLARASSRSLEIMNELQQILTMSWRQIFEIKKFHFVDSRIVLAGDEISILWNVYAVFCEPFADLWSIGHHRKHACVGFSRVAAAGAAIERRLERVVFRAAAMPAKKHEPGKISGQPHHAQGGFDGKDLFAQGEAGAGDPLHAREKRTVIDAVMLSQVFDERGFLLRSERDGACSRRRLADKFVESAAA